MSRFGDWKKLEKIMRGFDRNLQKNCTVALARAGASLEGAIKERILDGKDMDPNHPFTVAMKGSSKPLIADGDLLASVNWSFIGPTAVFVGPNRKSESGVDLAALHEREEGTRIKVTPKMRGYLAAHGFHLKKETTELFIPGRPYVQPAYRDFRGKGVAKKLFSDAVTKTLKGD